MVVYVIAGGGILAFFGALLVCLDVASGAVLIFVGVMCAALGVVLAPLPQHQSPASEANWVCSEYGGVASTDVSGNVFTCKDGHSFEFHG